MVRAFRVEETTPGLHRGTSVARQAGFGSLLIAAGVNPKALGVIMGHATIAMTFDLRAPHAGRTRRGGRRD
jgi:hypothetical protein